MQTRLKRPRGRRMRRRSESDVDMTFMVSFADLCPLTLV